MRRVIALIRFRVADRRCAAGPGRWRNRRRAGGQAPVCATNGYGAQGYYGMFAQNEDGFTAYEIGSPCIGKDVREVAESIGMGRGKVMGLKNVIGVQFRVDGTMADGAGMARLSNAEFHIAYYLPAMRMSPQRHEGKRPADERDPRVRGSVHDGTRRRKGAARPPR